jgi:hypothetical protein
VAPSGDLFGAAGSYYHPASIMRPVFFLALLGLACSTYREDLNRGQRLYEENQYDHALAIWRVLEEDVDSLDRKDQARYAYLRGMTDYRLGYRPYARYWLGVARSIEKEHPGGLNQEWKDRMNKSLDDLNNDVYGGAERFEGDAGAFVERPTDSPEAAPEGGVPPGPPAAP